MCIKGITNPCPSRNNIVPGVNNYFAHQMKQRYIHCDFDGRAFVRSCAPGTFWNQAVVTCTPENFILPSLNNTLTTNAVNGGYGAAAPAPVQQQQQQQGYNVPSYQQQQQLQQPMQASSYSSYQQQAPPASPVVFQQQFQPLVNSYQQPALTQPQSYGSFQQQQQKFSNRFNQPRSGMETTINLNNKRRKAHKYDE